MSELHTTGFDWHAQPHTSFLSWLVTAVLTRDEDKGVWATQFEALSEATDKFHNIVLTMQINGIEVDAMAFVTGVERNMDLSVAREADRIVRECHPMDDIAELVSGLESDIKKAAFAKLRALGIEFDEDEY